MNPADAMPGCRFEGPQATCRLWAPTAHCVNLTVHTGVGEKSFRMEPQGDSGMWSITTDALRPGDRYAFRVDGLGPYPDPASHRQPDGVHGFSEAVDTASFEWQHPSPSLPPPARRSIYELHVGAFSPEGTFEGARRLLPHLRDLGVSVIEIMPVADFPGDRNWGYDGVYLFAPSRAYGTPRELAALVDEAHGLGLVVILDVVYNHFGPDGNYLGAYNPRFFDASRHTPWGAAFNFTAAGHEFVRAFLLSNALHWLRDYRFDGLRLDATHAYCDDMENSFTAELRRTIAANLPGREILLYAEDERHPARFCVGLEQGGSGLDGIWADDWHHHLRRRVAGDNEGYFAPYDGTLRSIAAMMENGWRESTAESPQPLSYDRFLFCLQNHDQVGNRPFGERLHHQITPERYRALSALLLLAPETPLLFMGQEWAATTPFLYFTDHSPETGAKVTEGRRREFSDFSRFADPEARASIPDPQSPDSFARSKLDWDERAQAPHASTLRFYEALLELRNRHPALGSVERKDFSAIPFEPDGLILHRVAGEEAIIVAAWLGEGPGRIALPGDAASWDVLLTSEAPGMSPDAPAPIRAGHSPENLLVLEFARAGVWISAKPAV